ncbi:DNA methyltransferase [Microcoleus sp. BR0-C5]|uniref:DNA methyltransferase n=1 Tax=Microcoleus sp. BR0-C5 TaxID=2818713 RepID=UPI002FD10EC2
MSLTESANILGKPYFQAPNCLIYHMDCLEALKLLPDQFVDLTVTSPPYNIGKEYEKSLVLDEYLNWCEQWIAEVYRVTLDRGAFWLNLGYLSIRDRAKAIPN